MNSEMQSRLFEIVDHERNAGCTMADESLVPIAIRRWNSFNRRHQKSKNLTLEHRANDLLKIFLSQFPDFNYDESCLKHLAQSFALVLCTSTDNRDPILRNLSPRTCRTCGSSTFDTHGRVGRWIGRNGGGGILGAVCNNCSTAFEYKTCGIPMSHVEWSIQPEPMWLECGE